MLLDLVEEDDESDALDGGLELVVRSGNVTVEVTLDDLGRPLRGLLGVSHRVQGGNFEGRFGAPASGAAVQAA